MKKLLFLLIPLLFIVAACSSGGSSSSSDSGDNSPATDYFTAEGLVSDPPIKGAVVELHLQSDDSVPAICGIQANLRCQTFTDDTGGFNLILPKNINYADYYIKSFGGIDIETGIILDYISFESPLIVFDTESILIVSPATTIMQTEASRSRTTDIASILASASIALGLPSSVDPSADPASDPILLRRSYLLTKIALLYRDKYLASGNGLAAPFDAIKRVADGNIFSDNGSITGSMIDAIFNEFTADDDFDEFKADLVTTVDEIAALTGVDILVLIKEHQVKAGFRKALKRLVANIPASPSAEYISNVNIFIQAIRGEITESIPLDDFVITQIVKFCLLHESSLADYNGFGAGFSANLISLLNLSTFSDDIAVIIETANVILVTLPLDPSEILGNDNIKRIQYFFNSNQDFNYKAQQLISTVFDDDVHDDIYMSAVISYSQVGLVNKASNITNAYINQSLNKAKAKFYVGAAMSRAGDNVAGLQMLKSAEDIVVTVYNARGDGLMSKDEGVLLGRIAAAYGTAGDSIESNRLIQFVLTEFRNIADEGIKRTVGNHLVARQFDIAEELVESGSSEAEDALELTLLINDETLPTLKNGVQYNRLKLLYLAKVIKLYRLLGDTAKIENLYVKFKNLGDADAEGATDILSYKRYQYELCKIIGAMYWAGMTAEVNRLFDNDIIDSGKIDESVEAVAIEMSDVSVNTATAFIELRYPLDDDFGNIDDYLNMLTYLAANYSSQGLALVLIGNNDFVKAKEVLLYMESKLDSLIVYCGNNSNGDTVADFISELLIRNSNIDRGTAGGYVKIGRLYTVMNEFTAAGNLYNKAEAVADNLSDSFAKADSYASIAYYQKEAGNNAKAISLFAKARITTDTVKSNFTGSQKDLVKAIKGVAEDYLVQADKVNMEVTLDTAVTQALTIHETGGTDADAKNETSYLYLIAELYNKIPLATKFESAMNKSIESANEINSASIKKKSYGSIIEKYGEMGFVRLGAIKASQLFVNVSDFNEAIGDLASFVAHYDDFSDEDIALVDTDKDGKPDFFLPGTTDAEIVASNLVLDDDIDGDGKLDTVDLTPLYAD